MLPVHNTHPRRHKQYLHPLADLKLWSPGYYLSQSWNVHYVFPALFPWFLRFRGCVLVFVWGLGMGLVCWVFFKYPLSKKLLRSPTRAQEKTRSELSGWFPTLLSAAFSRHSLHSHSSLRGGFTSKQFNSYHPSPSLRTTTSFRVKLTPCQSQFV